MFNREKIRELELRINAISTKLESALNDQPSHFMHLSTFFREGKKPHIKSIYGRLNALEKENKMLYDHLNIESFVCNKEVFKASETSSQKQ